MCLAIIILIVSRKLSALKILDTSTLVEEKESKTKKKIVADRYLRKLSSVKRGLIIVFKPLFALVTNITRNFYTRVLELEEKYKQQSAPKENQPPVNIENQIQELSQKADALTKAGNLNEAEENCIKILELDSRNLDTYQKLADLYNEQKDYTKTKATFEYIVKLIKSKKISKDLSGGNYNHLLAECYEKLCATSQLLHEDRECLAYIKKAISLEPNNPKYLDLLLKISIILKDKSVAIKALRALKKADPANQKLPDFENEIKKL